MKEFIYLIKPNNKSWFKHKNCMLALSQRENGFVQKKKKRKTVSRETVEYMYCRANFLKAAVNLTAIFFPFIHSVERSVHAHGRLKLCVISLECIKFYVHAIRIYVTYMYVCDWIIHVSDKKKILTLSNDKGDVDEKRQQLVLMMRRAHRNDQSTARCRNDILVKSI